MPIVAGEPLSRCSLAGFSRGMSSSARMSTRAGPGFLRLHHPIVLPAYIPPVRTPFPPNAPALVVYLPPASPSSCATLAIRRGTATAPPPPPRSTHTVAGSPHLCLPQLLRPHRSQGSRCPTRSHPALLPLPRLHILTGPSLQTCSRPRCPPKLPGWPTILLPHRTVPPPVLRTPVFPPPPPSPRRPLLAARGR